MEKPSPLRVIAATLALLFTTGAQGDSHEEDELVTWQNVPMIYEVCQSWGCSEHVGETNVSAKASRGFPILCKRTRTFSDKEGDMPNFLVCVFQTNDDKVWYSKFPVNKDGKQEV